MITEEDQKPLYMQVIDQIKSRIEDRTYKEGEKLPSDFQLTKQYKVSHATLKKALQVLEEDGIVVHRPGVGTFVHTKPLFNTGIEEIQSVTNMIRKANMVPKTIYLSSFVQSSTAEDKRMFQNEQLDEILEIERVRTADGTPVVYCLDRLPYPLMEGYSIHEIKSISQFFEEIGRPISYAVTYIEPIGYHVHISEILECSPETALLLMKQMHYDDDDTPLFYSSNYFRANKFNFHVVRKRDKA